MTPGGLHCPEARSLGDEALDRPLTPGEARLLAAHHASCDPCRAEAAAAARVHEALAAPGPPDPGPAFTDRVVAALDRGPSALAPVPVAGRALRFALSALATAAVAATAVLVLPASATAAGLDGWLPADLGAGASPLPPGTGELLLSAGSLLPPWAAAAAACAVAALLVVEVAAARRRTGGGA